MKTYSISSVLHKEVQDNNPYCTDFENFSTDDCELFVRTGGTEGKFRELFERADGSLHIPGTAPLRILTTGESNSLAASMEILSYMRQKGREGVIIHNSTPEGESIVKPFDRQGILSGKRYAVIGQPSDWLISSNVDYAAAREVLGCNLIDIPMDELVSLAKSCSCAMPSALKPLESDCWKPKFGNPITADSFQVALNIYGALKSLIEKYSLDGLTIRCFDLLTSMSNTGCLALAKLNSEGFIATCEGDVPTMLSMAIGRELYGKSGFQVNLSKVEGERLLFAHCTIPLDMVEDFEYDTHFESGIGVAIHGHVPQGRKAHIIKLGADLKHWIHEELTLEENQYQDKLCRTQIWVRQTSALGNYMLTEPLGNHHVLIW